MRAELSNDALPKYFGYLEEILEANNSGWFVGDEMTIADIAVWSLLGWIAQGVLDDIPTDLPKSFKRLTHLYNKISKNLAFRSGKK